MTLEIRKLEVTDSIIRWVFPASCWLTLFSHKISFTLSSEKATMQSIRSKAILLGFFSLASMAWANGSFVQVVRESDISLTCERRGNECLAAGPGDAEYDLLAVWILAVLEQQEYGMDRKKVDHNSPDEDHWVFELGEWKLQKKEVAETKRAEKKTKHDHAMKNLEERWAGQEKSVTKEVEPTTPATQEAEESEDSSDSSDSSDRRELIREYKEELEAIQMEDQDIEKLEAFTKELYGADYDEKVHSYRRRLGCGSSCDMFCMFFCRRRRRNLRERIESDLQRRATEADRQLYFGPNMCTDHTTLKEFLHSHPITIDTVSPCVNDETWCMLSYPCSI